ncbi:MAG: hypothetical protein ACUZ9M_09820 [Candidatus Scalindua sp.]
METVGTRFTKLLKILIKIGIMMLVMTGLILFNKNISNANGSEKEGRKIYHQFTNGSIPD